MGHGFAETFFRSMVFRAKFEKRSQGENFMELIDALETDHKKIRKIIKEGRKKDASFEEKKDLFQKLAGIVTAHAKSEEKIVYTPAKGREEVKHWAYEGFEEHHLVDQLVSEDQSLNNKDVWQAKFKVICELLEHHLDEEESHFFPRLKKIYTKEERNEKGEAYEELYEELFEESAPASKRMPSRQREIRAH
jgi:hemerythrin superfamily protein